MKLFLKERVRAYNKAFPHYPPLVFQKGWIYGIWMIGALYKGSGYHGAYPPSYLERVLSMFPDIKGDNILHLFSGSKRIR